MTREEAIEYWEGLRKTFSSQLEKEENHFGRMHLQTTIDVLDTTISALRDQQELESKLRVLESNEPLTLDELRQMDGEPVWLHTFSPVQKKTNIAQWAILETVGGSNVTFLRAGVNTRLTKWFCNYGERWLAYRQKPEEGTV